MLVHGGRPSDLKPCWTRESWRPVIALCTYSAARLTFEGRVGEDGWMEVDPGTEVRRFGEPSPALGLLVGTAISGWASGTHEKSGRTERVTGIEPA